MPDWLRAEVPLVLVLAVSGWTLGGVFVVGGIITGRGGVPEVGLWFSMWGAVLTVGHREAAYTAREKAAFDLGRRLGAEEGGKVRSL
jgi:hypothetical protein